MSSCFNEARAAYPIVRNFDRSRLNGGSQTWDIAQDSLGVMYFGNKYGLFSFDSRAWTPYGLSNSSEVRSLEYDHQRGRLYAGGSDEFGYFAINPDRHRIDYYSLKHLLPRHVRMVRDVWNISRHDSIVWFQEDYALMRYNGHKINYYPSRHKFTAMAMLGDEVYAGCEDGTMARMRAGSIRFIDFQELRGNKIVEMLPHPTRHGVLIFTETDGIYIYERNRLTKMQTPLDDFMHTNQVFCAATRGDVIAVGTVNNGLTLYDLNTRQFSHINRSSGMQNNTVLSLRFDRSGNLWAGLDNGIDYICCNSPFGNLLGWKHTYGSGYYSMLSGNSLYLGTIQGLYSAPYPLPASLADIQLPQLFKGQVWNIANVNGTLMACSDSGLYTLSGNSAQRVAGLPGSWSVIALKENPDYALVSTYEDFYLMHNEGGAWKSIGKVEGYRGIAGNIYQDEEGNIWLAHWMRGIYRMRIDIDKKRFTTMRFYNNRNGLPAERDNSVMKNGNEVSFFSPFGYFFYDRISDSMKPHPTMNTLFANIESGRLYHAPNKDIWNMGKSDMLSVARATQAGTYEIDSVTFTPLANKIIHGFENLNYVDDDLIILSGIDGFYALDPDWKQKFDDREHIHITRIIAQGDSLLYTRGEDIELKIPYSLNSIRVEYIMPEYRDEDAVTYSCYLEDYDKDWSPYSTATSKEYTQLHEGNYTLHIRSIDKYNRKRDHLTMQFAVMAPWYRSLPAKIIYTLLFAGMTILAIRAMKQWDKRNSERATRQKQEELEAVTRQAEAESARQEAEIAELKEEQLQQEVKHKTEELSNAMLNLARKNEMLINLSESLDQLQQEVKQISDPNNFDRQIKKLRNLINQNISHDDDWRKFTHNFDVVYEGFIQRLQELHPTLTRTEVRVCCYLRMGLSSKDIAPLFNISYRSVEMTRYRLRKKLGLERSDNLTAYLESIYQS